MKKVLIVLAVLVSTCAFAQKLEKLTVEKIMRDPKWMGTSPRNPQWSVDGKYLFFQWNPEQAVSDSTYYITTTDLQPKKASYQMRQATPLLNSVVFNSNRSSYAYTRDGDVFLVDVKSNQAKRVTQTVDNESNLRFIENDTKLAYTRQQNFYAWHISTGATEQLTNFQRGAAPKDAPLSEQDKWLQQNQLATSDVLRQRKERREKADSAMKAQREKELKAIYLNDRNPFNLNISPNGRFVTYTLQRPQQSKPTIVPNYITESGYTTDINARTKVGGAPGFGSDANEFFVYDRTRDTVFQVKADKLPGIADLPDYKKDYPADTSKPKGRDVRFSGPFWNDRGNYAFLDIRSLDNKDRWIVRFDGTSDLKLLDRQRDEAWIGGPGIGFGGRSNYWIDENTFWFQSEATGYSHLYLMNVNTGAKTQLTSGKYEVQQVSLSNDRRKFYIITNEVHPGEKQFYQLPVTGGKAVRITTLTGGNDVDISPDEQNIAITYSYSNKPPELYLQDNRTGGKLRQVTNMAASEEFKSYPWMDPEVITFKAADGADVYARLYKPANAHPSKPAVIFVHGAGYLQNVHKWWSTYFREYMFHNLLAENGYTVLDIDYRASAGYGRDWRTGIYRFMGGKDLTDQVDGARYLVDKLGVNPNNIGIYGGSYGGFITLMGMFTTPGVFKSGAALRPVTDWAHYNHPYTANILNEPFRDSIAYRKSSPIYYAEGLKGNLLICHGMVDVNVHFQDVVRLTQRLIELGKENWELAVYPVEDHGFVEPSSWTDEYKRILKLFESTLKQ